MRKAISQAVAKETPRGWRITKQTSAHKIDLVAALSFACYACIQGQSTPSFSLEQMLANEREPLPATADKQQGQQSYAARNFQNYLWGIQGIDPRNPWGRGGCFN